jgi:hypothetical protein
MHHSDLLSIAIGPRSGIEISPFPESQLAIALHVSCPHPKVAEPKDAEPTISLIGESANLKINRTAKTIYVHPSLCGNVQEAKVTVDKDLAYREVKSVYHLIRDQVQVAATKGAHESFSYDMTKLKD